jgi:hypothetical protein
VSDEHEQNSQEGLSAVPGVVRIAASAWWNTTEWTVSTSVRATRRLLRVATAPSSAGELVLDVLDGVRDLARELSGGTDLEGRVPGTDVARKVAEAMPRRAPSGNGHLDPNAALRLRGDELLYKSRDVHYQEDEHPAYERLLDSLAPDEARILRLMLLDGPQPAVDVRTGGPLGLLNSRLLAPGLSMIGGRAGLRYTERVPAYLNNLNRLGLIWFSRETLRDPLRYQVIEAQPDVLEAIHSVRQAKIVRRSIHLTPFGEGFCRACLPVALEREESLPEHASPAKPTEPQPPAAS